MDRSTVASAVGTGKTIVRLFAGLSLAALLAACDARPSIPTVPTPPSPGLPSTVTYSLSGVVFEITETGRIPIEGVELYCDSCGSPDGHTLVTTDADGTYRLDWTANGVHPLFVTKAGYEIFDPAGTLRDALGRINVTVRGDTVFDVQLVRR